MYLLIFAKSNQTEILLPLKQSQAFRKWVKARKVYTIDLLFYFEM